MNIDPKYKFLLDYFIGREGEQILDVLSEVDLVDSGIIDSLDILEIAILIERNLGIKLNLSEDQTFSAMKRFDSIIYLLEKS
jgi:acyl carrier protein